MRGKFLRVAACCVLAGVIAPTAARAEDRFVGQFDGEALSVQIAAADHQYTGEIRKGGQHFALKANASENGELAGAFSTPDGEFKFTATLHENELTLSSGGAVYVLKKHASAINPLLAIKPDRAAPNGGEEIPSYSAVNATDFGKAFTADKPNATSTIAAFQSTFPDLARYFGEKPAILGVFEDVKDHRTAGASFTAHLHGQPVNGFVTCKLADHGAKVAVVFCRADAPKGEWDKLIAKPAATAPAAAPVEIKLREYQFPDATGTVGVAEGWTTRSPSLMTGVEIKGPADQEVNLAFSASINTPDSPLVQLQAQNLANARKWGFPPPAPLPVTVIIAPYSDPETALKQLSPQFSRISQANGGPALSLDKIYSVQKVDTLIPNGQAALILFDLTKTRNGVSTHYRSGVRWDMGPVGPGAWMLYTSQILAPTETYERDLPAMLAMALSLKENPQVIMEKTRINIEAANARFAASQRANHELQEAFEAQHRSWEHTQLIQSRSFADFDEVIVGYRTVEDTTTGTRHSVDLGNVHDVVNHLNEYSPGRFKEIPLRDEMYPLPGR